MVWSNYIDRKLWQVITHRCPQVNYVNTKSPHRGVQLSYILNPHHLRVAAIQWGLEYDGRLFTLFASTCQTDVHGVVIIFTQPFPTCNYLSSIWLRLGFRKCKHSIATKLLRHVQLHNNVGRKFNMTDKSSLTAYHPGTCMQRFQVVCEKRARDVALVRWYGLMFNLSIKYLL